MSESPEMNPPGLDQGLGDWLCWLEGLHTQSVDLGLDRLQPVARRLFPQTPPFKVLTVAGTNGKGSSVAFAERLLLESDCRVGAYTSPHLIDFNERIRLDGEPVSDAMIIQALDRVNRMRDGISLSYFEFTTLAALELFRQHEVSHAVLEVGLGGRLDAVNVVDADVALLTRVALDHQDWLGSDLKGIAREKAGVCRAGRPAIVGDGDPDSPLASAAQEQGAVVFLAGRDFQWQAQPDGRWRWQGPAGRCLEDLPSEPCWAMNWQRDNAAAVLSAMSEFHDPSLTSDKVCAALEKTALAGRVQRLPGPVETILDVAHNPDAARALASWLAANPVAGKTRAVIGMKGDKDIAGVVRVLDEHIDEWWPADLAEEGGVSVEVMKQLCSMGRALEGAPDGAFEGALGPAETWRSACRDSGPKDRVLVLGSFMTVGPVLRKWQAARHTGA